MDEKTEFEKLIDSVHQLAEVVFVYHKVLMEKGFSKDEALALAVAYQNSIMGMAVRKAGEQQ